MLPNKLLIYLSLSMLVVTGATAQPSLTTSHLSTRELSVVVPPTTSRCGGSGQSTSYFWLWRSDLDFDARQQTCLPDESAKYQIQLMPVGRPVITATPISVPLEEPPPQPLGYKSLAKLPSDGDLFGGELWFAGQAREFPPVQVTLGQRPTGIYVQCVRSLFCVVFFREGDVIAGVKQIGIGSLPALQSYSIATKLDFALHRWKVRKGL